MYKIWQETLSKLEEEVSPQNFSTWIKPVHFVAIEDDRVLLEVPNRFIKDWITDNYLKIIEKTVSEAGTVKLQDFHRDKQQTEYGKNTDR